MRATVILAEKGAIYLYGTARASLACRQPRPTFFIMACVRRTSGGAMGMGTLTL